MLIYRNLNRWIFCGTVRKYADQPILDLHYFLKEIGKKGNEATYWLNYYTGTSSEKSRLGKLFALIHVRSSVLQEKHCILQCADALGFLHRNSLSCLVIYSGLSAECSKEEGEAGLEEFSLRFAQKKVAAFPYWQSSSGDDSAASDPTDGKMLDEVLKLGYLPIVLCAEDQCPEIISRFLDRYHPLKFLVVNSTGGLCDEKNQIIPNITLPTKSTLRGFPSEMALLYGMYLRKFPATSSIVQTSASAILTELFTHGGSGTMFSLSRSIECHTKLPPLSSSEQANVHKLVNNYVMGVGKRLVDDYLTSVDENLHSVYIAEGMVAFAVVKNIPTVSIPYLEVFSADINHDEGAGSGRLMWDKIRLQHPKLFWRTRVQDPQNPHRYFAQSEGSSRTKNYVIFWYGCSLTEASLLLKQILFRHFLRPAQLHLMKPCPPQAGWNVTVSRKDTIFFLLTLEYFRIC